MMDPTTVSKMLETEAFQNLSPQLKVALFLGMMAFLSSALVTMTAFTRIVIVLSFIRRALSTQEIPPTQVILGLSLFLTMYVMAPTFHEIESKAVVPYLDGTINEWLDAHPEVEVKMVTTNTNIFDGKMKELALIVNIWY